MNSSMPSASRAPLSPVPVVEWLPLEDSPTDLGPRYMAIMAQMDRHYAQANPADVVPLMTDEGRAYYVGDGEGFELALGLRWYPKRAMYCVQSTGFVGAIEPWQAVELVLQKVKQFARQRRLRAVFAIVPDRMDNPRILQFYDILLWRGDLRVSGGHQVSGGRYWRIGWSAAEEALLEEGPEIHPREGIAGL